MYFELSTCLFYYYSNNTIFEGKCHLFCYFSNNLLHVLIIEHFSIECHQTKPKVITIPNTTSSHCKWPQEQENVSKIMAIPSFFLLKIATVLNIS